MCIKQVKEYIYYVWKTTQTQTNEN